MRNWLPRKFTFKKAVAVKATAKKATAERADAEKANAKNAVAKKVDAKIGGGEEATTGKNWCWESQSREGWC